MARAGFIDEQISEAFTDLDDEDEQLDEEADAALEAVLNEILAPVPRARLPAVKQVPLRQSAAAAAAVAPPSSPLSSMRAM